MKISKETLEKLSEDTGFRPEILEKVIHLIELLNALMNNSYLRKRIVLKGGTALNLFCYKSPRLSVDIDINYIGSIDKNIMLKERHEVIAEIEAICIEKDYISEIKPSEHAGGKWRLHYQSDLQGNPRLEIDLNFLARLPLWEIQHQSSMQLGSYSVKTFPILDKHELAAGKLTALFSRHASRDLFDANQILCDHEYDQNKLRLAFIVYGGMSRMDWRSIKIDDIYFEEKELKNMLLPMLRQKDIKSLENTHEWAKKLLESCKNKLAKLLPLQQNEIKFLKHLSEFGNIKPELLSDDSVIQSRIAHQPGLLWKAINVKKHRGLRA